MPQKSLHHRRDGQRAGVLNHLQGEHRATGPILPHDADVERGILGAILLGDEAAIDRLAVEDFFLPNHRKIFLCLASLKSNGKPTNDLLILVDALKEAGEIENAGGVAYVASIGDGLPRVQNLEHYVAILKTKTLHRNAIVTVQHAMDIALGRNSNEALDELSRIRFSSPLGIEVETNRIRGFRTGVELATMTEKAVPWVVAGLVVRGAITELCGKVKCGKTTFIMDMVRAVLQGVPFLGYRTYRAPVLYLSEQPIASLRPAVERAGLLGQKDFIVLQHCDTRGKSWAEVASASIAESKVVGASVIVVDTLSQFAGLIGDAENNAGDALEAMLPLQGATAEGIGVIVNRHERKSGGEVGDSGRGSSAFAGAVDIVLSLRRPDGSSPKNRRLLQSLSRFTETPNDVLIEWTGTEYVSLGERGETAIKEAKDAILRNTPEHEAGAMTADELREGLELSRATGHRAVEALFRDGVLTRMGKGKRGDPYKYYSSQPQS